MADKEEEEVACGFEDLGLEPRLLRAISKINLVKPTPIQLKAIPLILEGKDVVARAKTGSGKTLAYLLPVLQKLLGGKLAESHAAPAALVLVPTRELCQQVFDQISSLLKYCGGDLKAVQLTSSMSPAVLRAAIAGHSDIMVSTPGCLASCISKKMILSSAIDECLSSLVLDEADLLLSYGYEDDLQCLAAHIPRRCQCLLMSATTSVDLEKLKKLVLHNPVTLTLTEVDGTEDGKLVPGTIQQFIVSCRLEDKLLHLLAILHFELVQKKAIIFVNSIDASFKIKLFLEQFSIKSAVLNAELPQNSRLHILKEFNLGLFDYLIAVDDGKPAGMCKEEADETDQKKEGKVDSGNKSRKKRHKDEEFGVIRGVDFRNVYTVINYEMPNSPVAYIHRVGRTGRAGRTGVAVSIASKEEGGILEGILEMLDGEENSQSSSSIMPFPLLTASAVESLRYRAEDVMRGVTRIAIREARAKELRIELLNSERLKAHFEDNPLDLELLKHDKVLSKQQPAPHLRTIPEYLRDPTVEANSKAVKMAGAAIAQGKKAQYTKRKRSRSGGDDPLKSISSKKRKGNHEAIGATLWSRKRNERSSRESNKGSSRSHHGKKLHRRRKR